MARPVRNYITYSHPNFTGQSHPRGFQYQGLLAKGHAAHPDAGLFDETVLEVVKKGIVTAEDVARILAAADQELAGTGKTRSVFHHELRTLFLEWSWAFEPAAQDALTREVGRKPCGAPSLKDGGIAYDSKQSNALFLQAAADGEITRDEVEALERQHYLARNPERLGSNMRRLYAQPNLEIGVDGLTALATRIKDPAFVAEIGLAGPAARIFSSSVGVEEAKQLIEHTKTNSQFANANSRKDQCVFFEAALARRGIKNWRTHRSLKPEGRRLLDEFFHPQMKIDRTLREFALRSNVSDKEVGDLLESMRLVTGGKASALWFHAHAMADVMGLPYFEDPRFSDRAIAKMDLAFYGEATVTNRKAMRRANVWRMLEMADSRCFRDREHWHGDPHEDNLLRVKYSRFGTKLSIDGLLDETVTMNPSAKAVHVGDRLLKKKEAQALLQNPQVKTAIKALMDRAVTTGWRHPAERGSYSNPSSPRTLPEFI